MSTPTSPQPTMLARDKPTRSLNIFSLPLELRQLIYSDINGNAKNRTSAQLTCRQVNAEIRDTAITTTPLQITIVIGKVREPGSIAVAPQIQIPGSLMYYSSHCLQQPAPALITAEINYLNSVSPLELKHWSKGQQLQIPLQKANVLKRYSSLAIEIEVLETAREVLQTSDGQSFEVLNHFLWGLCSILSTGVCKTATVNIIDETRLLKFKHIYPILEPLTLLLGKAQISVDGDIDANIKSMLLSAKPRRSLLVTWIDFKKQAQAWIEKLRKANAKSPGAAFLRATLRNVERTKVANSEDRNLINLRVAMRTLHILTKRMVEKELALQ